MKITKQRLKEIIKEELSRTLKEAEATAMAEKQLKVLISAMQKHPSVYAAALEDVPSGDYLKYMDSWLGQIKMLANRAKQPVIASLVSRIHPNKFGTGQTFDQSKEEDHANAMKALSRI